MRSKNYLIVSGVIFSLITCWHLARLLFSWQVQVGPWIVSYWISWVAILGGGALSIWAFRLLRLKLKSNSYAKR